MFSYYVACFGRWFLMLSLNSASHIIGCATTKTWFFLVMFWSDRSPVLSRLSQYPVVLLNYLISFMFWVQFLVSLLKVLNVLLTLIDFMWYIRGEKLSCQIRTTPTLGEFSSKSLWYIPVLSLVLKLYVYYYSIINLLI